MKSTSDKLKGKAKKIEGRITGDKFREAQGAVQEQKGKIEGAVENARARSRVRREDEQARRSGKRTPR